MTTYQMSVSTLTLVVSLDCSIVRLVTRKLQANEIPRPAGNFLSVFVQIGWKTGYWRSFFISSAVLVADAGF